MSSFSRIKNISLCVAAMYCLGAIPAHAEGLTGFYIAPKAVYSYQSADSDSSLYDDANTFRYKSSGKHKHGKWGGGLALGYDFFRRCDNIPVRLELEYLYRGNNELYNSKYSAYGIPVREKSEISASTFFLNAYYDFHNQTRVTPYLGAGLGWGRIKGDYRLEVPGTDARLKVKNKDNNFVWNVGAGAAFRLNENISFDLGYRYSDLGKVKGSAKAYDIKGRMSTDVTTHEGLFAVRYTF